MVDATTSKPVSPGLLMVAERARKNPNERVPSLCRFVDVRQDAPNRDLVRRGQGRAGRVARGSRDRVRARLLGLLARFSPSTQSARCASSSQPRGASGMGALHPGGRHRLLLRPDRPGEVDDDAPGTDRRRVVDAARRQVLARGRPRRGGVLRARRGDRPGGQCSRRCWATSTCTTCSTCGSSAT
jgi:hypothetical protein